MVTMTIPFLAKNPLEVERLVNHLRFFFAPQRSEMNRSLFHHPFSGSGRGLGIFGVPKNPVCLVFVTSLGLVLIKPTNHFGIVT